MLDFESGLTQIQSLLLLALLIYESKQKLYQTVKVFEIDYVGV